MSLYVFLCYTFLGSLGQASVYVHLINIFRLMWQISKSVISVSVFNHLLLCFVDVK